MMSSSQSPEEGGTILVAILQMKKLRRREVGQLVQSYTARKL